LLLAQLRVQCCGRGCGCLERDVALSDDLDEDVAGRLRAAIDHNAPAVDEALLLILADSMWQTAWTRSCVLTLRKQMQQQVFVPQVAITSLASQFAP
jgi:hypothetical protein